MAKIIPKIDWLYPFWEDTEKEIVDYWKSILNSTAEQFSEDFINHILINAIVPYIYFQGKQRRNPRMTEKAFNILRNIKAEQNTVINRYKKLGVKVDNAYHSQALLEQYQNWCAAKKCMSCETGKEIFFETHGAQRGVD